MTLEMAGAGFAILWILVVIYALGFYHGCLYMLRKSCNTSKFAVTSSIVLSILPDEPDVLESSTITPERPLSATQLRRVMISLGIKPGNTSDYDKLLLMFREHAGDIVVDAILEDARKHMPSPVTTAVAHNG